MHAESPSSSAASADHESANAAPPNATTATVNQANAIPRLRRCKNLVDIFKRRSAGCSWSISACAAARQSASPQSASRLLYDPGDERADAAAVHWARSQRSGGGLGKSVGKPAHPP